MRLEPLDLIDDNTNPREPRTPSLTNVAPYGSKSWLVGWLAGGGGCYSCIVVSNILRLSKKPWTLEKSKSILREG